MRTYQKIFGMYFDMIPIVIFFSFEFILDLVVTFLL